MRRQIESYCSYRRPFVQNSAPGRGISWDSALGTFDIENVLKDAMHVQREETRFQGSEGARRATEDAPESSANAGGGRWSAKRKASVILELSRGADLQSTSRVRKTARRRPGWICAQPIDFTMGRSIVYSQPLILVAVA